MNRTLPRNTIFNLGGQALPLILTILVTPFVIRGLGVERFGVLALIGVVVAYFYVFDLGLSRAVAKSVSQALGQGESLAAHTVTWSAVTAQVCSGSLAALALIAIASPVVNHILHIPEGLIPETRLSMSIIAISLPATLASGAFRGALEAAQRFDLVNAVIAPAVAISTVIPLIGVRLGFALPGIVSLQTTFAFLVLTAYYVLAASAVPGLGSPRRPRWALIRDLLGYGKWVAATSIAGSLLLYLDRFLIGALLTLKDVTYYTAPFQIIVRIWIIPTSLAMALFPIFSASNLSGDTRLGQLYIRATKYLLVSTGPLLLILAVFARSLLQAWLGPDFGQHSALALQILLGGAFIGLLAPVPGVFLQGIGRPDISPKLYAIYLPVNALAAWILIVRLGIVGAALSFALRTAVDAILLHVISLRELDRLHSGQRNNDLVRVVILIIVLSPLLVGALFSSAPVIKGTLALAWFGATTITMWLYALDEADRTMMASIVRPIWFGIGKRS